MRITDFGNYPQNFAGIYIPEQKSIIKSILFSNCDTAEYKKPGLKNVCMR